MGEKSTDNIAGKLAKTFIDHPLTLILGLFILAIGYLALIIMPREENPQIKVAGGAIIVPFAGASPSQVQKVIIEPLERKLREIKGIEHIFSYAYDNMAIVQVQYFIGTNKESADLKLYDQVMRNIDLLPRGAMMPIVKTMDIDTDIPIATVAFYAKNNSLSQTQLYKKVNKIAREINKIDNVALVDLKGEKKEQYNVEVNLLKLSGFNLSLGQIVQSLEALSFETPDIKNKTIDGKLSFFGVENSIKSQKDIENIMVANYMGSPVYLKDIAMVSKSEQIQDEKEAFLYKDGLKVSQITMSVSKLKGANTVLINEKIFAFLEKIKPSLEKEGIAYEITRDDGYTANHAVNELVFHLLISVVIIAVLLVFALGFKEALIVSLTVPMILALTLFIGFLLGETINRITLFALLLSLGLLVDAAIIVIENIHRHLYDCDSSDKTIEQIATLATNEIGNPTNVATIAIILTFVPMFFVGGMMGEYMRPLPVFVPISLFVSLFVAYIFTPYFVKKLLKKRVSAHLVDFDEGKGENKNAK